jgi:hypothetical protein
MHVKQWVVPGGSLVAGVVALAAFGLPIGYSSEATRAQESLPLEILAAPASDHSSQPNLSTDNAGNVYMVWSERAPNTPAAIKFSRFDGTRWSPASTITSGRGLVASAADIPSVLALPSGRLVAHGLQVGQENSRGYGVRISQSSDGGATWSTPVIPHEGHETGENGFVSLYPASGDSAGIVWLDGRNFTAAAGAGRNQTLLLTARIGATGGASPHTVLDDRTCECCHTGFAVTSGGPVVVYRDRSAEEIRDISLVKMSGGRWSAPLTVHEDRWMIRSCPVNGPAAAAFGAEVAVAWFTGARDTARVQIAFSSGGVQRFSAPVRVDGGDPLGRIALAMSDTRTAWVSWLERHSQYNSQMRLRRVTVDGRMSTSYVLSVPNLTYATGFPRMVQRGGELVLAWSTAAATGAPPAVRVARVKISDVR